jgi:hypothetical protein
LKLCKNCKNYRKRTLFLGGLYCYCRENQEERFNPVYGSSLKLRDGEFEYKANKNGDCIWYVKKKWKFWVRDKKRLFEDSSISIELLLSFIREKYPEVVMEFYLTEKNSSIPSSTSRPKPTPNPTCGVSIR